MVQKCSVPGCKGNYKNGPKVSVFSFPKDETQLKLWKNAVHRDFVITSNSKVCELHFKPEEIIRIISYFHDKEGKLYSAPRDKPILKEGSVPSIFRDLPDYFSKPSCSRMSPLQRAEIKEAEAVEKALQESLKMHEQDQAKKILHNIVDLKDHLVNLPDFWTVIDKIYVMICHIENVPFPSFKYVLLINEDLHVSVFFKQTELKTLGNFKIPHVVSNIDTIFDILDKIENFDKIVNGSVTSAAASASDILLNSVTDILTELVKVTEEDQQSTLAFITEQVSLLKNKVNARSYSLDTMVFACILYTISPHAYKFIRTCHKIILPHPNTIRNLCLSYKINPILEQQDSKFLSYMRRKIVGLSEIERYVTLMLDEIHVKPYFDYKGGNITGVAFNNDNAATTAFVFMVESMQSKFKEVAHVLPVQKIDGLVLHTVIKDIICGLEKIGYKITCIISDNNSINKKAVSFFNSPPKVNFVYKHPMDPKRPLFFALDTVHLLKSIRNNWLNQKNDGQNFFFPNINDHTNCIKMEIASFRTIKDLYKLESTNLVKYGYSLTSNALTPSSIERQKVKLALQIFNEYVANALVTYGVEKNIGFAKSTAEFIFTICKWWNIVNVKSPFKGKRLKNVFQEPFSKDNSCDPKEEFLNNFLDWLQRWKNCNLETGFLTRETYCALYDTTHCILEFKNYCFNELGMSIFLTGKVQTDNLEARFGKYRRLSGSQYHISLRQLFESEHKMRLQSVLSEQNTGIDQIVIDWESMGSFNHRCFYEVEVQQTDLDNCKEFMPVLYYIAGYSVFSATKRSKCSSCKNKLTWPEELNINISSISSHCNLISRLNRGGLLYPSPYIVTIVLYNYVVMQKVMNNPKFLKEVNQRNILVSTTANILCNIELSGFDVCDLGHTSDDIILSVLWVSTNILLNNFCKKLNDGNISLLNKKRKLDKFSKNV